MIPTKWGECVHCPKGNHKPFASVKLKLCKLHFRIHKTKPVNEKYRRRSRTHWENAKRGEQPPRTYLQRTTPYDAKLDKWFRQCWESSPHVCQECDTDLGDTFSRGFVSHILSRGAHIELQTHPENFNILCATHHTQWESGSRRTMKIWKANKKFINRFSMINTE